MKRMKLTILWTNLDEALVLAEYSRTADFSTYSRIESIVLNLNPSSISQVWSPLLLLFPSCTYVGLIRLSQWFDKCTLPAVANSANYVSFFLNIIRNLSNVLLFPIFKSFSSSQNSIIRAKELGLVSPELKSLRASVQLLELKLKNVLGFEQTFITG